MAGPVCDDPPVALDDLLGTALPDIPLPATDGRSVSLAHLGPGRTVVYAYPWIAGPDGAPPSPDWDAIPGARGCTPESCGFRDHAAELGALGAAVLGLSAQPTDLQREAVERLRLPFALLWDQDLRLATELRLPTFRAAGRTLLKRLSLVVKDGQVERLWYPVFAPDRHAEDVLGWLRLAG
jgi:peroxiredoxin